MNALGLLNDLRQRGVRVWTEGGRLRLSAPVGVLDRELEAEIARHKTEIMTIVERASRDTLECPISCVARDSDLPLSLSQQRLWFMDRLNPGDNSGYVIAAWRLWHGHIDLGVFERSVNEVVRRHEILRTAFPEVNGKPVQKIAPPPTWSIPLVDLSPLSSDDMDRELERVRFEEAKRPFNLQEGPLFRVVLVRRRPDDHAVLLTMHHIISDGWSLGVLAKELSEIYMAFSSGRPSPLPELAVQYADYSVWQKQRVEGPAIARQLNDSVQRLQGIDGFLDLPTDRPRPPIQTHRGRSHSFVIPPPLAGRLRMLGKSEGATLFMTLAAVFTVLLNRYTGRKDILIGCPIAGRDRVELESLIGMFVNTVVLRSDLSDKPSFRKLLSTMKETVLDAFSNQDVPFEKIVEGLNLQRSLAYSPIFQVAIVLKNTPISTGFEFSTASSAFDLTLFLSDPGSEIHATFEYNSDLFDHSTISRMGEHLLVLSEGISLTPDRSVCELPIMPEWETRKVLGDWNATRSSYPLDKCVQELFEAQVEETPDAVAVAYEGQSLTYSQLNMRANQLAHYLRNLGAGPEILTGITLERSLDMIVALLGILKAGGGYVVLDPGLPSDRLAFMARDAGLSLIVTKQSLKAIVPDADCLSISLDTVSVLISRQPIENPNRLASPENIAYLLYTSGSTGKPKGVEISHRSLTNLLWSMRNEPGCSQRDVLLAVTPLFFDIAGFELFLPLTVGARIELTSRQAASDSRQLMACIERTQPTIMQATPATWRMLIDAGWRGAHQMTALCGGETLPRDLAEQLLARTATLWNMYGPTETTIWSSADRISAAAPEITIGRPIANTEFYILDENRQPLPIGIPGELFIAGHGLARGYKNRRELTAERFISNPVSEGQGSRLYRTGDLARYCEDGRVVHLGRLDHQVKVRGFRIELGEIEVVLAEHDSVKQAVVEVRDDRAGGKYLAAYVVAQSGRLTDASELRRYLKSKLPEYMVPQYFVELETLPLSSSGKIDRKGLPEPGRVLSVEGKAFVSPRNPVEERVARIWAEVLDVPRVGAHDDFFELGGHSMLAIQLTSRTANAFKVEVPLQVLFEAPTVARFTDELIRLVGRDNLKELADVSEKSRSADTEPRTTTERRLAAIWERLLGTAPIGIKDNFFDLQGNSQLFDQMLAETRNTFAVFAEGLPIGEFHNEPTIETLARTIDANIQPVSSLVVCLQPRGEKPPVFLIHAAGGYVFFYRALASRLGPDFPVYAVRAETKSDGMGRPFDRSKSIEELAARYISEIKTIQPVGPYSLGGACFGGVVAFEMARQLEKRGDAVGPVLLFDAFVLNNPGNRDKSVHQPGRQTASVQQRINRQLRYASQLGPAKAIWYLTPKIIMNLPAGAVLAAHEVGRRLRRTIFQLVRAIRGRFSIELKQRFIMDSFLKAAERLLSAYTPGAYDGRIVLFKAAEGQNPEPLWTGLACGGTVVYETPGTHLEMMEEPSVITIAQQVRGYLPPGHGSTGKGESRKVSGSRFITHTQAVIAYLTVLVSQVV